jgi:hypothetical protein
MYSYLISTNTKPHLSGVAKFGQIVAEKLGIPLIGFTQIEQLKKNTTVCLSVSFFMTDIELETEVWRFLSLVEEKNIKYSIFLHSFDDLPIEHALIKRATTIYAANDEIYKKLSFTDKPKRSVWTPALLSNGVRKNDFALNIFSFGMAFKIQTEYHKLLASKLKKFKIDYIIRFSTAFHEKANFGKYDEVAHQLEDIYGDKVQFYGFLSDEAVSYFINISNLYVNFFPKGVRSNNTTIFAVMKKGCPVITNLDEYSPRWMKIGKNILDVQELTKDIISKDVLSKIGKQAMKDVKKNTSLSKLTTLLQKDLE